MIPCIEDIVEMLLTGQTTKEQAIHWLYAHTNKNEETSREH